MIELLYVIIGLTSVLVVLSIYLIVKLVSQAIEIKVLRSENSAVSQQLSNNLIQVSNNGFESLKSSMENFNLNMEQKLFFMKQDNNEKLEKIRQTVDEKLQETLEKRLGESFKLVSEQLEQVYKGLGEMQTLATGVGDLKKVLANVKTRGVWAEVQLEAILEQILTRSNYSKNVEIVVGSNERVEFALKIPVSNNAVHNLWLPVDAKFPMDIYQKICHARENFTAIEQARELKNLEMYIKAQSKLIAEKYLDPRYTTDFAIMFLPLEGLYAEVLNIPGLVEQIQNSYRVVLTSPTTFSAILSSIQLGLRTMAIEKRSQEVWHVLASIKSEFIKFTDILSKTRYKIEQASKIFEDVEVRSRAIQRKLRDVDSVESISVANDLPKEIDESAA